MKIIKDSGNEIDKLLDNAYQNEKIFNLDQAGFYQQQVQSNHENLPYNLKDRKSIKS